MNKTRSLASLFKKGDFWFYFILLAGGTALDRLTRTQPGYDIAEHFGRHLRSRPVQALAVLAAVVVAKILFWLRSHRRRIYALFEGGVATLVVWRAFPSNGAEQFSLDRLLAYVGGVYILVRSIDNWRSATPVGRAAERQCVRRT